MIKERTLFLSIGQCGGNICKELEELGYKCFYINTSYEDLKTLNVNENQIYHIPNSKGCAKSRDKALNYAVNYYDEICKIIDSKFPTFDIIFIVNGAAGGTSAMSYILMEIMSAKNPDKYYNVISALPGEKESILVHSNAIDSLKQLKTISEERDNVRSIFLLDNNKRKDVMEINTEFAMLFDRFFSYDGTTVQGNVDGEELETLILDKGISSIVEFEDADLKVGMAKAIKDSIFADWNTDCNYIGAIMNKSFTGTNISESMEEYFGIPITDFTTYDDDNSNIIVGTGIGFNKSLISKLSEVAKGKLDRKKQIENESDEEDEEVALDLKSITKKQPTKKQNNKKDISKELSSILDKYKNM